jgi:asparagine synthase (glutamine-hydrolysing)
MCGIAGFYNLSVTKEQIHVLIDKLRHRGPDDQQFFQKQDVGLIHTRLSILELTSLGTQPYHFENLVLVFNGELYNYKEVREELKRIGYSFQSNSDTEVLIKSFHCWREKCVDHFIGMFAFGVYDEQADELYLFRDRVGVKPLYYSYSNGKLSFASELKAMHVFDVNRSINPEALSYYFRFGFVPGHLSIYTSVKKLQPGHYIKVTRNEISIHKYWGLVGHVNTDRSENDWLDELESLLVSAFRYRMVSDVPVGVFLSGGIDSSLLTAILQKHNGGIHSFTIGFYESGFDESVYAKQVAAHLQTNHTQKILGLSEAKTLLNQFYTIYDEPFADTSGIPTAYVTQLAKQSGMKVVLSADGGDELFGGYTHYNKAYLLFNRLQQLPRWYRKQLVSISRKLISKKLRQGIYAYNFEHKIYALEELLIADKLTEFFEAYIANQSFPELEFLLTATISTNSLGEFANQESLQNLLDWDFTYYLPDDLLVKVDRATMYYGVECREPFLDHRVIELAHTMPISFKLKHNEGKYPLKKLISKYLPKNLIDRKKQGFSIPIFQWFKDDLDILFADLFSDESLREIHCLDSKTVKLEWNKYNYYKKKNLEYNIEKMWRIASFILWYQAYGKGN